MINIVSGCCDKQFLKTCEWQLKCKRFMFLMKYFIIFATVAITEIVSFFPFHRDHC